VIDLDGPEPLWRQVADHLAGRIAAEEFARRLPSVRTLADQYGVSHTTVSDALRELSQRGLVVTTQGRGSFVQRPASEQTQESEPDGE
jgi:DNA-binding GntR family transcriptional regulator